jgi:hypothetical protein
VVVYDKNSRPSFGVRAQAVREGTVHRALASHRIARRRTLGTLP